MTPVTDYDAILTAPFGALGIYIDDGQLTRLEFLPPGTAPLDSVQPLIQQVARELAAYYADPNHVFDLPVHPTGTPFRHRVWQALMAIPAGQTRSYGEIARQLNSAARAVGQAAGDNPLPIVIPCHRVIAADGGLGGFNHSRTGFTQDIKRWLLGHERVL